MAINYANKIMLVNINATSNGISFDQLQSDIEATPSLMYTRNKIAIELLSFLDEAELYLDTQKSLSIN
jgi:hypothetical protein